LRARSPAETVPRRPRPPRGEAGRPRWLRGYVRSPGI
jgi:hypothetical protein